MNPISTEHLNEPGDSPRQARAQLFEVVQRVNEITAHLTVPAGVDPITHARDLIIQGSLQVTGTLDGNAATAIKLQTARQIAISGDATGSGNFDGSENLNLAVSITDTGVQSGTYGSATQISPFTVNSKGQITSVGAAQDITPSWNNILNKPTTVGDYGITDAVDIPSDQTVIGQKTFTTAVNVDGVGAEVFVRGKNATVAGVNAPALVLQAGFNTATSGRGGNVVVRSGGSSGNGALVGSVIIQATASASGGYGPANGNIFLQAGGVDPSNPLTRFVFRHDGGLGLGSYENVGTAGQVPTSNGPGQPLSWTTPSGGGGGSPAPTYLFGTTSRYQVVTTAGLGATMVSSASFKTQIAWTRSATTLTVNDVGHGRSVGERAILRNMNTVGSDGLITSVTADSFTVEVPDSGATSGSAGAYSMGFTFAYNAGAGSISGGTVSAPANWDCVLLSIRMHLGASTRSVTTFNLTIPKGNINGAGPHVNMDSVAIPMQTVRQDGNTLSAVGATIATNLSGDYGTYQFAALPPVTTGIHIVASFA